jgi:phasin family protein
MTTASNPFTDLSKLFEHFKIPGVNMTSVIAARRADIDALAEANKRAYEGMQLLVRREMEFLITTMREVQTTVQKMDLDGSPTGGTSKNGEFVEQTLRKSIETMRGLAEIVQRSQAEALAGINKCVGQPMKQQKTLLPPI